MTLVISSFLLLFYSHYLCCWTFPYYSYKHLVGTIDLLITKSKGQFQFFFNFFFFFWKHSLTLALWQHTILFFHWSTQSLNVNFLHSAFEPPSLFLIWHCLSGCVYSQVFIYPSWTDDLLQPLSKNLLPNIQLFLKHFCLIILLAS